MKTSEVQRNNANDADPPKKVRCNAGTQARHLHCLYLVTDIIPRHHALCCGRVAACIAVRVAACFALMTVSCHSITTKIPRHTARCVAVRVVACIAVCVAACFAWMTVSSHSITDIIRTHRTLCCGTCRCVDSSVCCRMFCVDESVNSSHH